MRPTLLFLILLLLHSLLPTESQLTADFYAKTCPNFAKIVQDTIIDKQLAVPTTAAGALRLFFHDCIVGGCDASLLLTSNDFNTAERDFELNKALPGDAFEIIIRAKTKLELECPEIVSCADILAEATRDLVSMVGGPFYPVLHGRRDAIESKASEVEGHIARPNMTMAQIIDIFAKKGFSVPEMVALIGSHTIGFSHCAEFAKRIYHFSEKSEVDPAMNPSYAEGLRKLCANYTKDPSMAAFNDPMTPGKFDNMYFLNLQKGIALLASDQALVTDPQTKRYVDEYAADQKKFFDVFTKAMDKVGQLNVLTGEKGEIRNKCDAPNQLVTPV